MIVDTCLTVGVSPMVEFIAEEQLGIWLDHGAIDMQFIYQPDESFQHETPAWNPFLGNDYIASVQRSFPGQVRGLATVQPWHQAHRSIGSTVHRSPALEELERAICELGLHGLRVNPIQHNVQFNNATVMWPVLDLLTDLQRRVERRLLVSVHAYGDSLNNSPDAIADTAKRFPDLLFLMQHAAFVWGYGSASRVAAPIDNLLLDLSTMPQRAVVWEAYQRHGARRFCIGSDGPHGTLALKSAIVSDFARDDREAALILGDNLAERLQLPTIQPTTVHGPSA